MRNQLWVAVGLPGMLFALLPLSLSPLACPCISRGLCSHPPVPRFSLLLAGAMERLNPDEKRLARLTALRDLFQVPEDLEMDWVVY
jgi:hypothetical protein